MIEVHRHELLGVVGQDSFEWTRCSGRFKNVIDLIYGRFALRDKGQINDRHIDGWHAHCKAIKLAIEFRQHQTDSSSRTSLGRDHAHRCGAGATQIFVINVR